MTFQAFQQPNIFLGSGTTFGNGYTDRNVNLGYAPAFSQPAPINYSIPTQPAVVPNPEFKTNPYGLEDDQAVEKWGKSKRIVAKDASEGLKRNLQGIADLATLGVFDFDNRGNLFGGKHLPGLRPGSGYGGQAELGKVPKTIPSPTLPTPQMPNINAGPPVPGNFNMGKYYGTNAAIGLGGQMMSRAFYNQGLDDYYNRALQARQDRDAQDVLASYAMQRTDKGQSERATEQQNRMFAAAQTNYLRRLGVAALSNAAANKIKGYDRTPNPALSSASVGNWGVQRMG